MVKTKNTYLLLLMALFLLKATITHAAGLIIPSGNTVTIDDATLNVNEGNVTIQGTLQSDAGSINVNGDWSNTGTFNAGTGKVDFTGTSQQTISGSTTFHDFICNRPGNQLFFETGETQTILSAWTIVGEYGNPILLRSTIDGTQWKVDPQGTRDVSYADVKDSHNISAPPINPINWTDSGNNTNWVGGAASPPVPNFGNAIVDSDISEWDLTNDFFANMWRAGNSQKPNPSVDAKLYLRYDCENEVLYALVLGEPEGETTVTIIVEDEDLEVELDDHFIKLGNSTKLVDGNDNNDGTPPDFAWVGRTNGNAEGWEASVPLSEGIYNNLNVHTQVFRDGEAQTAAVDGRAIDLQVLCEPTAVEITAFTATSFDGEVMLEWETVTEIDNAGFNLYRAKRRHGSYKKINDVLIEAEGDAVSGAAYSYIDIPEKSGRYFYKLEDIDINGNSTMHGAVKVRVTEDD